MKKMVLAVCLLGLTFAGAVAQDAKVTNDNYPYWTISKEVARMNYKNVQFVPATITTGSPSWIYAKSVGQINKTRSTETTKVTMTGTPSWVISKGVAQMQMKKTAK